MPFYVCDRCEEVWPRIKGYETCERCARPTRLSFQPHDSIDLEDAERRKKIATFDRLYAEREAERERQGLPSPDTLGRLEAQRLVDEVRRLDALVE
jgi:hypothetical protein